MARPDDVRLEAEPPASEGPANEGPQFTAISAQLAERLPTEGVPPEGVASAFRDTLYAARDRGILAPVADMIGAQGRGDAVVEDLATRLKREADTPRR